MQKQGISAKQAVMESQATSTVSMEVADETLDRLEEYKNEKGHESVAEAAVEAMETELFRGQEEA